MQTIEMIELMHGDLSALGIQKMQPEAEPNAKMAEPSVEYPDRTGFQPEYSVNSIVFGGCSE